MFWIGIRCFPYGSGLPILTSKANKALPIPSHPILCIIISLVSLIELKAKQAVVAPLIVMYFLSIRLQLKKKKKAFWNRQVDFFFLQVFFSFNWNNTLNWYLIIPPQYSLKMMRFAPDRMLNDYKTGILEIKNWCCFQSNTEYQLLLIDRAPCSFLLIKWLVSSYLLQWEYVSQGPFKMNI